MNNEELFFILNAIREIQENYEDWSKDYEYNRRTNEFHHKDEPEDKTGMIKSWFTL